MVMQCTSENCLIRMFESRLIAEISIEVVRNVGL